MNRRSFTLSTIVLFLSVVAAWWAHARQPEAVALTPSLSGQPEYCLTCHADLPEISASHPVKVYGCVICHGGERLALDADLAHSTMRGGANPSDLSVVEESCGGTNCHSGEAADQRDHIQRVMTSVQSTYAGAIANIRYTFGAQKDLRAQLGTSEVRDTEITTSTGLPLLKEFDPQADENPSITKFGQNCLTCHLNAQPREGKAYQRFLGCASCHSFRNAVDWSSETGQVHSLSTAIPYKQCNTCHNRGNYDLRQIHFVERQDDPMDRLHDYYQPIAQFTKCEYTLDCIDCHTRNEAMGDGDIHSNKKEIQYTRCATCHGTLTELPLEKTLSDPNDIAFRLTTLNPVLKLELGDTILVTEQGEPLWNTRVLADGSYQMTGKATGQVFTFRPVQGSRCTQSGEDQSSSYCHSCHAVERSSQE